MTGLNSKLAQLAQGHSQLGLSLEGWRHNILPGKPTEVPEQALPLLQVCTYLGKVTSFLYSSPLESWRMPWGPTLHCNPPFPWAGWAHPAHWASPHAAVLQPPATFMATESLGNWGLERISPPFPHILSIDFQMSSFWHLYNGENLEVLRQHLGINPCSLWGNSLLILKSYPEVWIYNSNPPRHMAALRNVQDRKMCRKYQHIHGTCLSLLAAKQYLHTMKGLADFSDLTLICKHGILNSSGTNYL